MSTHLAFRLLVLLYAVGAVGVVARSCHDLAREDAGYLYLGGGLVLTPDKTVVDVYSLPGADEVALGDLPFSSDDRAPRPTPRPLVLAPQRSVRERLRSVE